jgi:hypothetical protein
MVDYVFPAAAVDRAIREAWPGDVNASARQFLLEELAKRREGQVRLIRALELIPRKTEP